MLINPFFKSTDLIVKILVQKRDYLEVHFVFIQEIYFDFNQSISAKKVCLKFYFITVSKISVDFYQLILSKRDYLEFYFLTL